MTAAGGRPALTVAEWRTGSSGWCATTRRVLLVIDTATGATQVDPWGRAIQEVYADLRLMLAAYPELAIMLSRPRQQAAAAGRARQLSDVLGEWGRWCDVVVLQENDGEPGPDQAHHPQAGPAQRRIVATKPAGCWSSPWT